MTLIGKPMVLRCLLPQGCSMLPLLCWSGEWSGNKGAWIAPVDWPIPLTPNLPSRSTGKRREARGTAALGFRLDRELQSPYDPSRDQSAAEAAGAGSEARHGSSGKRHSGASRAIALG